MGLRTEYSFTLPKGFVDAEGKLHRHGTMRLATARDEIEPLRDGRAVENEAYLTILILARVVTELGSTIVSTEVIESLFAADLAYLQEFYGIVNFGDPAELAMIDLQDFGVLLHEDATELVDDDTASMRRDTAVHPDLPWDPRATIEEVLSTGSVA